MKPGWNNELWKIWGVQVLKMFVDGNPEAWIPARLTCGLETVDTRVPIIWVGRFYGDGKRWNKLGNSVGAGFTCYLDLFWQLKDAMFWHCQKTYPFPFIIEKASKVIATSSVQCHLSLGVHSTDGEKELRSVLRPYPTHISGRSLLLYQRPHWHPVPEVDFPLPADHQHTLRACPVFLQELPSS